MQDSNSISQLNHEGEFERAWTDPSNTGFELPPVDVNRVLAEHYRTSEPLTSIRTMLWDMEVRKAWRPDRYIPSVVREGSAHTWGRRSAADGAESFMRSSQQRLWLEPAEYGLVLEKVYLNPRQQKVTFIGAAELPDRDSNILRAGTRQPLSTHTVLLHLGMVIVGLPYSFKGQMRMDEITGGSPYGASTLAGQGERQPSANELEGARFQDRHVAQIAARLKD